MTLYDYAMAGFIGRESERPPYASSPAGMAFQAGVICRLRNINLHEIKQGRGYTWIINRTWVFNFKDSDINPRITHA